MGATAAQAWLEEGRQSGLTKGQELRLVEGEQAALLALLRLKFGAFLSAVEERVRATQDVEQFKAWLRRVLTASSLAEMGLDGGDEGIQAIS